MIVEANGRKHFWVFLFAVLSLSQGPEQKNKCADESVVSPSYIEECATTSAPPTSSCPFPPLMDTHPQWVPRLLFHFYENEPHLLCVCALIYRVITASREKKKFCRRISWRTGTASPVPIVLTGPVDEALHLFSCVNGHLDWLLDRPFKRLEHDWAFILTSNRMSYTMLDPAMPRQMSNLRIVRCLWDESSDCDRPRGQQVITDR